MPSGTVLMSFKLSIGKVAIAGVDLYTNEAIAGLIIKDNDIVLNKWVFLAIKNNFVDFGNNQKVFGSSLNSESLRNLKLPLPPLSEQQKIIAQIEPLEKEIEESKNFLATVKEQKQAILDKYLK